MFGRDVEAAVRYEQYLPESYPTQDYIEPVTDDIDAFESSHQLENRHTPVYLKS